MVKNLIIVSLFIGSFYLILTNQWGAGMPALIVSALLSKNLTGHYWFSFESIFSESKEINKDSDEN